MERRKLAYEFEHANSLEELAGKAAIREADGWVASTRPREIAVQIAPHTLVLRFAQSFYRPSENMVVHDPWAAALR